ncbi:hypothetical protein IM774_08480 [Erysipelotrichaceae bacterium RD49]|nr:hypothetical protein [Erysipelotrichaceae bacterium RD49]
MGLFRKSRKSADPQPCDAKEPVRKVSRKEKKKASDLSVLIDETQPDAILSELRENRNMILGGRYVAIMLDNNALPDDLKLTKKNRKSEAIGSFLSAINKDQISAAGIPALLNDNRLVIIPNYITLDNLDSFVDFRNQKLYPFTYVLVDDSLNVTDTKIQADFPTLEAIVSSDDGPDNATLEYALGIQNSASAFPSASSGFSQPEKRQDFVSDQVSPDPSFASGPDFTPPVNSQPEDEEEEEEEAVFIPEDETYRPDDFNAVDQDIHEEYANDSRPLDPDAGCTPEQEYPENLSDFQSEDVFDPYAQDAAFPDEPLHDYTNQPHFDSFADESSASIQHENPDWQSDARDPDMVLNTIATDATPIQFQIENLTEIENSKPLQFDLLSEDDWYASSLNNLIRRFNSDLSTLHQTNIQQLAGTRNAVVQILQKNLAEEFDVTDPDTEYGRQFAALELEKNQAIEAAGSVSSLKKQQIREEYEKQLLDAQSRASMQAKADFESRNLHRFNREIERVDTETRKQIEFDFEARRNDLQNRMADEIRQEIAGEVSLLNEKSFKFWQQLTQKEKQMFDDFSRQISQHQSELQLQNSQRIQLERDSLEQNRELARLNHEYSAKLQSSQAEYEHQINLLKDSISASEAAWKSRQSESEQKYRALQSKLDLSDQKVKDLETVNLETRKQIEKEVRKKFKDELEQVKKERNQIEESYKNIEKTQKKINSTGIMISAVVAVLAITIGVIIGMLINFSTTSPAAAKTAGQSSFVLRQYSTPYGAGSLQAG